MFLAGESEIADGDDALLKLGAGPVPIGECVELLDISQRVTGLLLDPARRPDCSDRCSSASGPEGKVSVCPRVRTQGSFSLTATTTAVRPTLAVSALPLRPPFVVPVTHRS